MKSKTYRAVDVNHVRLAQFLQQRREIYSVLRLMRQSPWRERSHCDDSGSLSS